MIMFTVLYKGTEDVEVIVHHGTFTNPEEKYAASFCDFEDACTFMVGYLEMKEKNSD